MMGTPDPVGGNPFGHGFAAVPAGGPGVPPPARSGGEVNTLATLSIIFAFIFAPAGAVLGHLGLSQIARSGQPGHRRALTGLIVSYVIIAATVLATVVWVAHRGSTNQQVAASAPPNAAGPPPAGSTAATARSAPIVAPSDLAALLPSLDEVKTITKDQRLSVYREDPQLTGDVGDLNNPDCWPVLLMGSSHAYQSSGLTGWSSSDFRDTSDSVNNPFGTSQGVAAYPDASAARRQVDELHAAWQQCGGNTVHRTQSTGSQISYTVGAPVDAGEGITTIEYSQLGAPATAGPPLRVVHALAAKANIVVDAYIGARQSGNGQRSAVLTIVRQILNKIPSP